MEVPSQDSKANPDFPRRSQFLPCQIQIVKMSYSTPLYHARRDGEISLSNKVLKLSLRLLEIIKGVSSWTLLGEMLINPFSLHD